MRHVIAGELIEVGQIIEAQGTTWPGMAIRVHGVAGSKIVYVPLNWPEAKEIGASLYDNVTITIESTLPEPVGSPK